MRRAEWERMLGDLRQAHRDRHAPQQPSPQQDEGSPGQGAPPDGSAPSDAPRDKLSAIIYGASWCQPCHAAAAFLRSRCVSVVEHDVEKQPRYAREMQQKLHGAGQRGGSIPVIDIGGIILQGYNRSALDGAIARLRRSTAL
jgi:glutaredoxin